MQVNQGGGGDFKTINEAIKSIPTGNTKRVIIKLAPGVYREKVTIDVGRPFITLMGKPGAETTLTFDGTASKFGTMESATLIVWAQYFVAANLHIRVRIFKFISKLYIYISISINLMHIYEFFLCI